MKTSGTWQEIPQLIYTFIPAFPPVSTLPVKHCQEFPKELLIYLSQTKMTEVVDVVYVNNVI
jgi:hypothetical protein